jgi:hypothetical protein
MDELSGTAEVTIDMQGKKLTPIEIAEEFVSPEARRDFQQWGSTNPSCPTGLHRISSPPGVK